MMLKVKSLYFSYQKHKVLNGLSFTVQQGECVCLLGENGAGKTTLFKCIMGFFSNYKGKIYVHDSEVRNLSVKEIAKKIAYIPQAHAPTFNYSVIDIVLMGTNALVNKFRSPGKKELSIVNGILELLGISHLAQRGYADLSGGERQLVLIARALAQKSKILIMDEPTANLDYGNQFRIMKQVKKLAEQGYLILISTHNPEHALHFADKVLILNNGQIALYGDPRSIITPDVIQSIYGVSVEIHTTKTSCGNVAMIAPYLK
jgi:iron complex transport system ATP-binding protein